MEDSRFHRKVTDARQLRMQDYTETEDRCNKSQNYEDKSNGGLNY